MKLSKAPVAAGRFLLSSAAGLLAANLTLSPGPAAAQVPGQNVNMVSGTEWPYGDPFKQRQNEPSVAVSTRNPLHLLAGANDYRTVDIPFADNLPNAKVVGDAWLGLFKSFDGGQTWQSTLVPGYPQDTSPEGLASPLKGYSTAADPTVRAANNGLFHYSGIAFNRGSNQGVAFVAQYLDLANKENGRLSQGTDPIRYVRTVVVEGGNSGQFLDKPWIAVDIPRGSGTCTFTVPTEAGPVTQTIPAGNVYAVYSVFVGNDNNIKTKIYFRRSTNCGATWGNATKLTEGLPINQGAIVEVAPTTGHVYVAWRGFSNVNTLNTINIVRSTDGGLTFTKPLTIHSLPDYNPANPTAASFFDQGTTATSFRTNAFPAMAIDADGRVYVAWSQRGMGPHGDARIVLKTSADGLTWPADVQVVDPNPVSDDLGYSFTRGHQLMPSVTFAGGKLMVLYYDLRYDQTLGIFQPNEPFDLANGKLYFEKRQETGEWLLPGAEARVFTPFIDDAGLTARRHTIDVRVAQADPALNPVFSAAWVSQYRFGTRGGPGDLVLQQLQVDPPNLPLFKQGTAPFFGDYIEIAGLTMRPDPDGTWRFTTAQEAAPVHYAVFTSNQDVRPPPNHDWSRYTPPASVGGTSLFDPTQRRPPCETGFEGTRDQNIYVSRITQGLAVGAPQNAKRLTTDFQRNFPVTLQNLTAQDRSFRLTIPSQPPGGFASFVPAPVPFDPDPLFSAVTTLDVMVGAHAGAARSVYATSTTATARITVNVDEIDAGGSLVPGGLSSWVVLNPEGSLAPPLLDPDEKPAGTSIQTVEIYTPNVTNPNVTNPNVTNPNVTNPNVTNPNVTNPNVTNPNVTNPNVTNPDIADPNVTNPNVTNPNVTNPNVTNPNVTNPNVTNPNVTNAPLSDATYTITNHGNTSATYTVKLVKTADLPADANLQLLVNKTYAVPVASECKLVLQTQTTTAVNVPNPVFTDIADLGDSTILDPSLTNPTFALGPGESALVTLRGTVEASVMSDLVTTVAPVAVPQVPNTDSPSNTPEIAAPLFVTTASLPDGVVGQPYVGATATAIGATPPYTFSASGLPADLSISPTGSISGTAAGPAGTANVILTVTDSTTPTLRTASRTLPLRVLDPLVVTTVSLPNGVVGLAYAATLTATGGSGSFAWSATGTVPPGLALSPAGDLAGTTTTAGSFTFTVHVTDGTQLAQRTFTVTVRLPPDLTVTLTHDPPNPTDLDIITATAIVTNSGSGTAGPSWLELCVGGETPGPNGNCRHTLVPSLAPGQSYTDQRENTLSVKGYMNHARADYLSEVVESNEGNNEAADSYNVVAASGVTVSGTVFFSIGGLSGVTVELVLDPFSSTKPPLRRAITDAIGGYQFNLVSPGTYWVKAYGPTPEFITWIAYSTTVAAVPVTQNLDLPKVITLVAPPNGTTGTGLTPTLSWNGIPEATSYSVQLNETAGWVLIGVFPAGGATSFTVPNGLLTPGTNYTWQVEAYGSGHDVGTTVNSFNFTTAP